MGGKAIGSTDTGKGHISRSLTNVSILHSVSCLGLSLHCCGLHGSLRLRLLPTCDTRLQQQKEFMEVSKIDGRAGRALKSREATVPNYSRPKHER